MPPKFSRVTQLGFMWSSSAPSSSSAASVCVSRLHSPTPLLLLPPPPSFGFFSPQASNSTSLNFQSRGKWAEMTRVYFNGDSPSASCIIIRKDIPIHTRPSLSLCTFGAEYLRPLSPAGAFFPHTSFFLSFFHPKQPHNILFVPLPFCQH